MRRPLVAAALSVALAVPAAAQVPAPPCTPERPVVVAGGSLRVRFHLPPEAMPAAPIAWSAAAGRIAGEGTDAVWDFTGVPPGAYEARAAADGRDALCTVSIVVVADTAAARGGLSARGQLVGARAEGTRYGLYSYVLFRGVPSEATEPRHREVLAAYLRLIPSLAALEEYREPEQLNVTYVPVERRIREPTVDSLLAAYNYARAAVLLAAVPGARGDGPYLVSSRTPLAARAPTDPVLVQDLSSVPPELASLWVSEFVNQAAQERFWEPRTVSNVALRMRTAVGVLARGVKEVRGALDDWIAWGVPGA